MKKKLKCIVLIDDDKAVNFIHAHRLKVLDCAQGILSFTDAREALTFLKDRDTLPELIFLDINMPEMTGWEFLNKFKQIKQKKNSSTEIIMVSASPNPNDYKKAKAESNLALLNKPLSKEDILKVL